MFSSDPKIREIQEESLIALKYFHLLCVTNSINYTVHAGTMLGAVREKGYIPWDDDVDLAMMRTEYKKWEELMFRTELEPYYSFDTSSYVSPRICLQRPGKPLVWLTIFIYDYVSEFRAIQKVKTKLIGFYYFMLNGHEKKPIKVQGNPIKGFAINCIRQMGKAVSKEHLMARYRYFCERRMVGNKTHIQRANDRYCYQGVQIVLPALYMSEYILIPFEDMDVMISKFYDQILTSSYGNDYMIPKKDATKTGKHSAIRSNLEAK